MTSACCFNDDFPAYRGNMEYFCLGCNQRYGMDELHYTCPKCGGVFLLNDLNFEQLRATSGQAWRDKFDLRAASKRQSLRGIFRFYELIAPVFEEQDIVYLGEGNTPIVAAAPEFAKRLNLNFAYKNDGQNPSASFKDRGMACAFSYLKAMVRKHGWNEVLTVCASTGDTSASAALYASYVGGPIRSVVLLPHGKVTPQQLSQPLGSGAIVLEMPGVFDDCMKVVERLADNYRVALLNSKNAWRILGQESYAFEVAQWCNWDMNNKAVFVPIGNAGNITAVMAGFIKLFELGVISQLPQMIGVQSSHADPVFRYYNAPEASRKYQPVEVVPSVAQAAMIGNPVSFPRVELLAKRYLERGGAFDIVQVCEQGIMDAMLEANRHGHIACTQGGECLAGLLVAKEKGLVNASTLAILDSTAHALKFSGFQDMYFSNSFPPEYEVTPKQEFVNKPEMLLPESKIKELPKEAFYDEAAQAAAKRLNLETK